MNHMTGPSHMAKHHNNNQRHTAWVLGMFDTGLAAVRSLGRVGIPVIGLDSNINMPGFKSKYCTTKLCPHPVNQQKELLNFLLEEGRHLDKPGIIFPTSDAFVLFISRHRNELATYFRFNIATEQVIEAMINKRRQYEMVEHIGIQYPKTFYPESYRDILSIKESIEYPSFIKPCIGHLWREKIGESKGYKVKSPLELQTRFEEIFSAGLQAMIQEIIPGPNTNHFKVCTYIDSQGDPLAVFTLRKIRQLPAEFGVGTMVESLYYPQLAELGLRFFRGIGYRGIGSIEFKIDCRDNHLKLIELNPRLWQQNAHATVCGMNFPLLQYIDLTQGNAERVNEFVVGIKWLDEVADLKTFLDRYQCGELTLWDWLQSLKGTRSFAKYALDDLGPFLTSIKYGMKIIDLLLYILRHRK